ncbi:hypothetical protein MHB40_14505 [Lysinibacillus sp. FSL K6-0057]|uniref:hypothetical protein n=1 Tax=unclassified Lysinibacillus TaxID=2636778 RepID=UPI00247FB94B|nr:hypothetical protein [Lysinibacillus sp. 1 U-2021]WGT37754.1 hypothetical protein QH639_18210 [Lysinibacillus sp. 1 U-2021]
MQSPVNKLKLIMIKSNSNSYISDNINNEGYFYTKISDLLFDGNKLENTYDKNWFKINSIPTKIEKVKPKTKINQRYELKEGYPESELTPKVVNCSDFDDNFDEVRGLYTYKYDEVEEGLEIVEFEINVIEEVDGEFEMKQPQFTLKYNLLDQIQTHPKLLPLKPCKLTHEQSYKIIRDFVKNNINSKYAAITSDYDFCFTVKKKIELYEPRQYQVDINSMYKRRKPKYETRYQRSREVTVFEVAPSSYQSYTVVTPFEGASYEDLLVNIDTYLNELITKINEPLTECECCKGTGVILDDNN